VRTEAGGQELWTLTLPVSVNNYQKLEGRAWTRGALGECERGHEYVYATKEGVNVAASTVRITHNGMGFQQNAYKKKMSKNEKNKTKGNSQGAP